MTENKTSDLVIDKDIVLSHIDKTYNTLQKLWESMSRALLTQNLLSLLIIILSSGIISVDEQVDVSGLKFKVALWLILGGGALFISILFMTFFTLDYHAAELSSEIIRLYKLIGYNSESFHQTLKNAFETPNFITSFLGTHSVDYSNKNYSKKRTAFLSIDDATTGIGTLIVSLILPIAAEVAAGIKVASSFEWKWWSWLPFVLIIIFSVFSCIGSMLRSSS